MSEQGGFWARQAGNLREQFSLPRTADGRVNWTAMLAQGIGSVAGGPLGGMAMRGMFGNMSNPLPQMMQYGRIGADSFGRMFDGDSSTSFFNNPSWGGGPRNVAEGHRDFTGPPSPQGNNPFLPSDYDRATSQGNWNRPSPQGSGGNGPQEGSTAMDGGIGGRSLASINSALRYLQTAPTGARGYGIAGRMGVGGNQDTGIGAFNGFSDLGNSRGELQRHNYEN